MLDWSEPVESADVPLVPDDDVADAVVWLVAEDVAPIGPSMAMTLNASTNVASDAAITRLRMRPMRAARARSLAWASSLGERVGSELGRSARGRSKGGGSDMDSTVGARSESTLGAAWEIPESPRRPRRARPLRARRMLRHLAARMLRHLPARMLRHLPPGCSAAARAGSRPPPSPDSGSSQGARRPCLLASRACRPSRREGVPMKPKVRRLAVIVGASAALGAAGCGGAASTQSSASGAAGSSQSSANGAQSQPGPGGFDLAALATKLGVSEAKVRAAMAKTRPTGAPGQAPSGTNADPATALAKQLGLSATKVRAAMQALRPSGAPPQGATPPQGTPPGGTPPAGAPAPSSGSGSGSGSTGTAPQGSGRSTTSGSAA